MRKMKLIARQITLERVKNSAEIVTFLGAAVWAIWIFYYRDIIVPATAPARLTISSRLEIAGRTTSMTLVKATVRARNESNIRVHMVGSVFNLKAHRVEPRSEALLSKDVAALIDRRDVDFVELPQWAGISAGEIVNSGRLFPINGWWLDANEEQDVEFITFVPNGYDLVSLRSEFRMSRERDGRLLINWKTDERGSASMVLRVSVDEHLEIYDHDRHYKMLKAATPYRNYSLTNLALVRDSSPTTEASVERGR